MTVLSTIHCNYTKRRNLQEVETPYLSEEVIEEILVRLPLQSILRFNSVCKSWHSLIQSRSFIDFHRAYHLHDDDHMDELFFSRSHSGRLIYTTTVEPYVVSCLSNSSIMKREQSIKLSDLGILRRTLAAYRVNPPLEKFPKNFESGIYVLGPLNNGISCVIAHEYVRNTDSSSRGVTGCSRVAICNLGTRQFNFIPYPFVMEGQRFGSHVKLDLVHYFGFCSIESHGGVTVDYKMVVIEQNEKHGGIVGASVYSQQRGRWDVVYDSSSLLLSGLRPSQQLNFLPVQALLHGCCHWMAGRNSNWFNHIILHFDMRNEVFGVIAAPPEDEYTPYFRRANHLCSNVFVLDGCLAALILVKEGLRTKRVDVWRMMEYGVQNSWKKILSSEMNVNFISRCLGMSFCSDTNSVERIFFERDRGYLISWDGSAFKEHRKFKHYWACWKPLGISASVQTLEPAGVGIINI